VQVNDVEGLALPALPDQRKRRVAQEPEALRVVRSPAEDPGAVEQRRSVEEHEPRSRRQLTVEDRHFLAAFEAERREPSGGQESPRLEAGVARNGQGDPVLELAERLAERGDGVPRA